MRSEAVIRQEFWQGGVRDPQLNALQKQAMRGMQVSRGRESWDVQMRYGMADSLHMLCMRSDRKNIQSIVVSREALRKQNGQH